MPSPNLGLPFMVVGQSNKEITFNELVIMLDVFTQGRVLALDIGTPPSTPANGDAYIIDTPASGAWDNKEDWVAVWFSERASWLLLEPKYGWEFFVIDEDETYWFAGGSSGWVIGRRP